MTQSSKTQARATPPIAPAAQPTYITTTQAAKKAGVCTQRILSLLAQHRIPGAKKHSGVWLIPDAFQIQPSEKRKRPATKAMKVWSKK